MDFKSFRLRLVEEEDAIQIYGFQIFLHQINRRSRITDSWISNVFCLRLVEEGDVLQIHGLQIFFSLYFLQDSLPRNNTDADYLTVNFKLFFFICLNVDLSYLIYFLLFWTFFNLFTHSFRLYLNLILIFFFQFRIISKLCDVKNLKCV